MCRTQFYTMLLRMTKEKNLITMVFFSCAVKQTQLIQLLRARVRLNCIASMYLKQVCWCIRSAVHLRVSLSLCLCRWVVVFVGMPFFTLFQQMITSPMELGIGQTRIVMHSIALVRFVVSQAAHRLLLLLLLLLNLLSR